MKKTITNLLLRAVMMAVLLLGTSSIASAAYYVKGTFNDWGDGIEMTQIPGEETYVADITFTQEVKKFKIISGTSATGDGATWYGSGTTINWDSNNAYSEAQLSTDGGDIIINWGVTANLRFYIHVENNVVKDVVVCHVPTALTSAVTGTGAVTFKDNNDNTITEARYNEVVKVVVAPGTDYYAENANVKAQVTLDPTFAQAPGVGQYLTVSGTDIADDETPATYTFVMPANPYGVHVDVDFQECIDIAGATIADIADQAYTGSAIEPKPAVTLGGETLTEGTDFEYSYSSNVDPGTATVTVTGKGKYKGTATKNFTIALEPHDIVIQYLTENPEVTGCSVIATAEANEQITKATYGTQVRLLTQINDQHYTLQKFEIWNGDTEVTYEETGNNEYTFTMPNNDVYVKPFFVRTKNDVVVQYSDIDGQGYPSVEGCSVTANPTIAAQGETITLTVNITNTDFELKSVDALETWPTGIEITKVNETTYTFVMPNENVYVKPKFTRIPKLYLKGTFNNWTDYDTNYAFTKQQDGTWKLENVQFNESVNFGFIDENALWYGSNGTDVWEVNDNFIKPTEAEAVSMTFQKSNGNQFKIPVAGKWTFIVDSERNTLKVVGNYDYAITIVAANATVTTVPVDRASAKQTVTVTVVPDEGYTPQLTITGDESHQPITYNAGPAGTNTYTFDMPFEPVTITTTADLTVYNVTLVQSDAYTLSAEPVSGTMGTRINVTAESRNLADFEVVSVIVTPSTAAPFEATKDGNGWYFNMPAANVEVSAVVEAKLHGVAFTVDNRFATYIGNYNLALPEGVTAYIVTEASESTEVTVEEVPYIPANVGVLLYCEDNKANITTPLYDGTTDTYTSKLTGNLTDAALATGAGYVLYNDTFYLTQAGTLAAHRCYLPIDALESGSPAPARMSIRTAPMIVTGIDNLNTDNIKSVKYVNLSGVVSDTPFEGINIMVITNNDGTTRTVKMVK